MMNPRTIIVNRLHDKISDYDAQIEVFEKQIAELKELIIESHREIGFDYGVESERAKRKRK